MTHPFDQTRANAGANLAFDSRLGRTPLPIWLSRFFDWQGPFKPALLSAGNPTFYFPKHIGRFKGSDIGNSAEIVAHGC